MQGPPRDSGGLQGLQGRHGEGEPELGLRGSNADSTVRTPRPVLDACGRKVNSPYSAEAACHDLPP